MESCITCENWLIMKGMAANQKRGSGLTYTHDLNSEGSVVVKNYPFFMKNT